MLSTSEISTESLLQPQVGSTPSNATIQVKLKGDSVPDSVTLYMFWETDGGGQEIRQSVLWAVL